MSRPKVSVIIPVYNAEKTLNRCLDSVLRQNYPDYEVIVVDNNSKDKSRQIIKGFQKNSNRLKYVFEGCPSVAAARNNGISQASGEIMLFTDSDCIIPDDWIKALSEPIRNGSEQVVLGFEKNITDTYWSKRIQQANRSYFQKSIRGSYINTLDGKNFAIDASVMKKLLFDPQIRMLDDFDLYMRLRKITRIKYLDSVKVGHYHKSSFKSTVKMNFARGFWSARIYQKYRSEENIDKIPMLQSNFTKNALLFPFWMVLQLFTMPPEQFYFILISELSWRAGILRERMGLGLEYENV